MCAIPSCSLMLLGLRLALLRKQVWLRSCQHQPLLLTVLPKPWHRALGCLMGAAAVKPFD